MMLWLNGELVDQNTACIAPDDRGFLLGDGLFETMLFRHDQIVDFQAHMDRMRKGAETLALPIPHSDLQILGAAEDLIVSNQLRNEQASLRFTVSRGSGPRGLPFPTDPEPICMMTSAPYAAPPQHMSAIIAETRRNDRSPLSNLKSLSYLDNVLARQEAQTAGADEAIMLNTKDRAACASAANLFIIEAQQIVTPPLEEGVLPGVTRAKAIQLANKNQIRCSEQPISYDRLTNADAIFLTNSLMGICPISRLSKRGFEVHSTLQRLQALYKAALTRP